MMAFRLGLTGSIGMGKSSAAASFRAAGVPVWDADAAVHRLYAQGGAAVVPVAALCPEALQHGAIDRMALKAWLGRDPGALGRLEAVVHPLVAKDRSNFIQENQSDLLVFDIPLLFEKGSQAEFDATLLVTTSAAEQRRRVLARPGMTEAQLDFILSKQMPDADKRSRATHIVETLTHDQTRAYILALIAHLRARPQDNHDA